MVSPASEGLGKDSAGARTPPPAFAFNRQATLVLLATRRQGCLLPASFCIGVSLLVKCDNDKRTEGDAGHDDFRPGVA